MKNSDIFKKLLDKVESVDNILVTVSRNPSVDELTAALALTLALNQLKKRAVAVFSGHIPPVMKFLNPEKTFETNADSLRDFIISISKDKADRLRVRPEGDFVKVYITPYHTKITAGDLKFSEGEFNVQLVIAFGVTEQADLDASIASHGRIFHNAVAATINLSRSADKLGTISLQDIESGCYCVSCYQIIQGLDSAKRNLLSDAVATALLTGIVSATDQFRNNVTSPEIMRVAAELMSKGANQQLISSELDEEGPRDFSAPAASDDISENDSLTFSREQEPPTRVHENKRYDLSNNASSHEHLNDPVERRLRQDTDSVNNENSADALRAARAQLDRTNASAVTQLKEPEVARPQSAAAMTSQPEQRTVVESVTPLEPPKAVAPTPASQVESGLYGTPSVTQPPLNAPAPSQANRLPFNEPNQVSPIRPIQNQPVSGNRPAPGQPVAPTPATNQPTNVTAQSATSAQPAPHLPMPSANQVNNSADTVMASGLPPMPPAPVSGASLTSLPPSQPTVNQSGQPEVAQPASDPSRFVIPGSN